MALIVPEAQNNPTWPAQAVLDNTDLNALYLLGQATGVISGFQLSGNLTSPSSTVISGNLASGTYTISGNNTNVSANPFQTPAASTGDRRDIVVASGTTVSVIQGTAITIAGWNNGSIVDPPVKPAVPAGCVLLAEIYVPGTAAFTAVSNTWYTDKTAIYVPIPGPQGYQGAQGSHGNQGTQGFQGVLGAQGAQGPQGYQGSQGNQGNQGYQGSQGYQGVLGAQGYQGYQGVVSGTTPPSDTGILWLDSSASGYGTQGPQGYQGFQGATGSQGFQGNQGNQGNNGNQGYPIGLQGAQGATRYVGGTTNGAPTSGTFAVGDFIIDLSGTIWVCTTAGTPGTWTTTISSHLSLRTASSTVTRNEITIFSGFNASQTLTAPSNPIDGSTWTVVNKASVSVNLSFTPSMIPIGSGTGVTTYTVSSQGTYSFVNYNGSQWYMVGTNGADHLVDVLSTANGGTGLSTIGTAGQALVVNSGSNGLTYSTIGAQGSQGAQGPQGNQGNQGAQGFQGVQGAQGNTIAGAVLTVTGTAYTAQSSDNGKTIEFTSTSTSTYTLPSGGMTPPWFVTAVAISGSGQFAAYAASGSTLNGLSNTSQFAIYGTVGKPMFIWSDGTNYFANLGLNYPSYSKVNNESTTQTITSTTATMNFGSRVVYSGTGASAITLPNYGGNFPLANTFINVSATGIVTIQVNAGQTLYVGTTSYTSSTTPAFTVPPGGSYTFQSQASNTVYAYAASPQTITGDLTVGNTGAATVVSASGNFVVGSGFTVSGTSTHIGAATFSGAVNVSGTLTNASGLQYNPMFASVVSYNGGTTVTGTAGANGTIVTFTGTNATSTYYLPSTLPAPPWSVTITNNQSGSNVSVYPGGSTKLNNGIFNYQLQTTNSVLIWADTNGYNMISTFTPASYTFLSSLVLGGNSIATTTGGFTQGGTNNRQIFTGTAPGHTVAQPAYTNGSINTVVNLSTQPINWIGGATTATGTAGITNVFGTTYPGGNVNNVVTVTVSSTITRGVGGTLNVANTTGYLTTGTLYLTTRADGVARSLPYTTTTASSFTISSTYSGATFSVASGDTAASQGFLIPANTAYTFQEIGTTPNSYWYAQGASPTTISGDLTVGGANGAIATVRSAAGNFVVASGLTVSGASTQGSTTVNGTLTASGITNQGSETISGSLSVSGSVTITGSLSNVQVFPSPGSMVWSKPSNFTPTNLRIICIGGGGGGGGGGKGNSSGGGGGGAGGNACDVSFSYTDLGSPPNISGSVGAGGTAGTASSSASGTSAGGVGGAGGATWFGATASDSAFLYVSGGLGGGAGTALTYGQPGQQGLYGMWLGGYGATGSVATPAAPSFSNGTFTGGGGGGAGGAGSTNNIGGVGGVPMNPSATGAAGGTAWNIAGSNGANWPSPSGYMGGGGGGGYGSNGGLSLPGSPGGNGVHGGGGGGGGAVYATGSGYGSGAGGTGGNGIIVVIAT